MTDDSDLTIVVCPRDGVTVEVHTIGLSIRMSGFSMWWTRTTLSGGTEIDTVSDAIAEIFTLSKRKILRAS